ncbi:MAG TPA: TRAP transporter large permease subunit [Mycobacteriales bacterium]|nr:TRAP transporter large permease subunit [Mycobacteriales bacterium]
MVALGLVLVAITALLTGGIVLSNTDTTDAAAFGVTITDVSIGALFLVGTIAGLVFMLGVMLMLAGASRRRARSTATRNQVRSAQGRAETLEEQNARLAEELAQTRAGEGSPSAPSAPDDPTSKKT